RDPGLPVIMITGHGTRELAYKAIQGGAYDFFEKPFKMDEFATVLQRALERRALTQEVQTLSQQLDSGTGFASIVGESEPMRDVFRLVNKVMSTDVTVLIRGESGTGKELVAEAIHRRSPRHDQPFVKLNCVAIPESLLESELFGHEEGSFTGATARRQGKFEQANHGTIFLDEIGDMSLATQAKILRVLQEREFDRVGGSESVKVDVRVIAATNKDLVKAVEDGTFREDLYFRLNVFSIGLPPLRSRQGDLARLIDHFVARSARKLAKPLDGFSPDAMNLLLAHSWPGNVRELENVVERAAVLADRPVMDVDCLPAQLLTFAGTTPEEPTIAPGQSLDDALTDIERQLIRSALRHTGGVQTRAAKLLGITERSLWHRVKKLDIDVDEIKDAKPGA
ncbi:sigma-54-dependent Fis family transcriptional regulator, partial [bacterium]|nr:sigma-54-dependent Fis family transcriptional regulator [bacterium]